MADVETKPFEDLTPVRVVSGRYNGQTGIVTRTVQTGTYQGLIAVILMAEEKAKLLAKRRTAPRGIVPEYFTRYQLERL
jgi:hypothetical protein